MPAMRGRFTIPPVGTIYGSLAAGRAWKVVRRTEKTVWLQELKVDRSRTKSPGDRTLNRDRGCNHAPHRQYRFHPPRRERRTPPDQGHRAQA